MVFGILEGIAKATVNTAADLVADPIGTTVDVTVGAALTPFTGALHGLDFLEGLTEGQIREKAIVRFGASHVEGLVIDEVIQLFADID